MKPTTNLRPRKRSGRCYELALKYLMASPDEEGWHLVHGDVNLCGLVDGDATGSQRAGHAWLVRGDTVYDTTLDQTFSVTTYEQIMEAVRFAEYTKLEAAQEMSKSGHSGPWDDTGH